MCALERGILEFPEVIHYSIKSRQSKGTQVPGTCCMQPCLCQSAIISLSVRTSFHTIPCSVQCSGQCGLSINSAECLLHTFWQIALWVKNKTLCGLKVNYNVAKGSNATSTIFSYIKNVFPTNFRGAFVQKEIVLDSQRGFCPYLKTSVSLCAWVPVDFMK